MRRLIANSSVLAFSIAGGQVLTALAYLLVARQLTPQQFGPLAGAAGLAVLLATVADFGMNAWSIRALAREPRDTEAFSRLLSAKVLVALSLGGLWVFVCLAAGRTSTVFLPYSFLGLYIGFAVLSTTLLVPLRAREAMVPVGVVGLVEKGVALIVTVGLLWALGGAETALCLGLATGSLVASLVAWTRLENRFRTWEPARIRALFGLVRDSFSFGVSGAASQLSRADIAIVTGVAGGTQGGLYAAPSRLTPFLGVLPTAFSAAVFPRVARAWRSAEIWREAWSGLFLMMLVTTIGLAALFVLAKPVVHVLLGSEYAGSVPVLRLYLVGMIFASLNQPLANFLQAFGDEGFVARVVGTVAVIGLGGIALGAWLGGAVGAAVAFIASQAAASVALALRYLNLSRKRAKAASYREPQDRAVVRAGRRTVSEPPKSPYYR